MRWQNTLVLVLSVLATPVAGIGQDTRLPRDFFQELPAPPDWNSLEPGSPSSWFGPDGYERHATADLQEVHGNDVVLQVGVNPSFHNSFTVGIRHVGEDMFVFRLEMVWDREGSGPTTQVKDSNIVWEVSADGGPGAADDVLARVGRRNAEGRSTVPVSYCERSIDTDLAKRIRAVWKAMILDARPPTGITFGDDGATYHFSMPLEGGLQAEAHKWSPPEDSRTGHLVAIADAMVRYCESDARGEALAELDEAVAVLAAELE